MTLHGTHAQGVLQRLVRRRLSATPRHHAKRRLHRGWLILAAAALAVLVYLGNACAADGANPTARTETLHVGFTFSPRQAEYLDLPWRETFQATAQLSPALVRLGAYWDEIERQPGQYDFSGLDWLVDRAEVRNTRVLLTVGMKAPRHPEYFLPSWLERRLRLPNRAQVSDDAQLRVHALAFIEQVIRRYRSRAVIAAWQVENEPLDPAGPHAWRIGEDFLRREVAALRALDERPIVVNMFVDAPVAALLPWDAVARARARAILQVADVLGLDVYPSRGVRVLGHDLYLQFPLWSWRRPLVELQELAEQAGKPTWIIEAQAEPWEPARIVYTDRPRSRSVQPTGAAALYERLRREGFGTILLWGVEYWQMRRLRHEDDAWWKMMADLFPKGRTASTAAASEQPDRSSHAPRRSTGSQAVETGAPRPLMAA